MLPGWIKCIFNLMTKHLTEDKIVANFSNKIPTKRELLTNEYLLQYYCNLSHCLFHAFTIFGDSTTNFPLFFRKFKFVYKDICVYISFS
jgi:hypothetical protein